MTENKEARRKHDTEREDTAAGETGEPDWPEAGHSTVDGGAN